VLYFHLSNEILANPSVDRYIHSYFAFFADIIRLIPRKVRVIYAYYAENNGHILRMDGFVRILGSLKKGIRLAYFLDI
jgi:hypothetical protein